MTAFLAVRCALCPEPATCAEATGSIQIPLLRPSLRFLTQHETTILSKVTLASFNGVEFFFPAKTVWSTLHEHH